MGRAWVVGCAILAQVFLAGAAELAWGYIPTMSTNGSQVTWRAGGKLNLAGNSTNQCGLDAASFEAAVVRSLQRWSAASGGRTLFDYWQGTDPSIYVPNSAYNGLSSLYFASNANADPHVTPNVLGLTQVWYDAGTGRILETDIVLNDRNFQFTTNPLDTSGFGSDGPTGAEGGKSRVYIENVLTHELGHAFGLSHSGGLQSTMLFMESPEQAHLGCDEETGIRALYPGADAGIRGAISGRVVNDAGEPVFGAHVLAISRRRGTVIATALSGPSGFYRMVALEPGTYFLMVEPYFSGAAALPSFYSGMKDTICSGSNFSRGFLLDGSGAVPVPIEVAPGAGVGAPTIVARCEGMHGSRGQGEIFNGLGASGFGYVDGVESSLPSRYRLRALSGHLEIHALSYSLYSPVRVELSLVDSSGRPVSGAQMSAPVYEGDSGYVNYDSSLTADGLAAGDYELVVRPSEVEAVHYPAGNLALDSSAFLLLTGSLNEPAPMLASAMPLNARCRDEENFPAYSSPGGNPPRSMMEAGNGSKGTGFCSMVATKDHRKKDESPWAERVGWILPWFAMLVWVRCVSRLRLAPGSRSG